MVLSARRTDRLASAVAAIRTAGGSATAMPGDVTSQSDMTTLVERTVEMHGRLDVLIANAGIGYHDTFAATPPDVMQRLVDVNLMGTLFASRAAAVQFVRQQSGHLIVMSSIVARRGIAGSSVYSATKAAQAGLVEALRAEWHGTPLCASVIFPVSTVTEFHDAIRRDYGFAIHGRGPKQRAATVAEAVVRCIDRPRAEVYPYRLSRALAVLNILAPALSDRVVRRFSRRRQ